MTKYFINRLMPLAISAILGISIVSCGNKEKDERIAQEEAINKATREELATAVSERDELLQLVNEINSDVAQVKEIEGVLSSSVYMDGDMPSNREQLKADLASIQKTLKERRERLAQLEQRLKKSNLDNNNLSKTISSLKQQIDTQTQEIATLTANLSEARERIGQLSTQIDSLGSTVDTLTVQKEDALRESTELANELNACYYCIGSKKELKEHKIIETGFLRKTKIMKGDFDEDFFTAADKRSMTRLPLHSKKAKILTNQPSGSYNLQSEDGQYVLTITNPSAFWSLSNYLVIQID